MNHLKKRMLKIGMAAAIIAVGVGVSTAYFTDNDKAVNKFTVGDVSVNFGEPEWDPNPNSDFPDGDGKKMFPGYAVYKNPTVENISEDIAGQDGIYTRMIVKITDSAGNAITDQEALALVKQTIRFDKTYTGSLAAKGTATALKQGDSAGYLLEDLNDIPMVNPLYELDEERSSDHILVYNYMGKEKDGKLKTGEEAALFTTIVIPADWNQTQLDKVGDFDLEVISESIQSVGFTNQEEAYRALDKEMEGRQ
ncbi:MAG: SipW-dependent-type signal peptide-containing protein [Muricoprocola sp.]